MYYGRIFLDLLFEFLSSFDFVNFQITKVVCLDYFAMKLLFKGYISFWWKKVKLKKQKFAFFMEGWLQL